MIDEGETSSSWLEFTSGELRSCVAKPRRGQVRAAASERPVSVHLAQLWNLMSGSIMQSTEGDR